MTFSEALEQYLDARDKLVDLEGDRSDWGSLCRSEAYAAQQEAAERMDELAPVRAP